MVASNLVLCVFGDVRAEDIRARVTARLGALPAGPLTLPATQPEHLASSKRREDLQPKQQGVLLIGYSGIDMFHPDRYALEIIDNAFSGQGSQIGRAHV